MIVKGKMSNATHFLQFIAIDICKKNPRCITNSLKLKLNFLIYSLCCISIFCFAFVMCVCVLGSSVSHCSLFFSQGDFWRHWLQRKAKSTLFDDRNRNNENTRIYKLSLCNFLYFSMHNHIETEKLKIKTLKHAASNELANRKMCTIFRLALRFVQCVQFLIHFDTEHFGLVPGRLWLSVLFRFLRFATSTVVVVVVVVVGSGGVVS